MSPPTTALRARQPTLPPPVWDGIGGAREPTAGPDTGRVDPALLRLQQPLTAHSFLPPGHDPHQPRAPRELTNPRFAGDRDLERILAGEVDALSAAHNGRRRAVGKVQQALVDLGFELPMHAVDGDLGSETEEAIRQFRAVHAPPASATLDDDALLALDRAAPPPGERVGRTADYDRLLADDRLDITVAVGHSDETIKRETAAGDFEDTGVPYEQLAAERFREWLQARGFELTLLGLGEVEHWKATKRLQWTSRDGTEQSREIEIWLRLVTPGTGSAQAFGSGLSEDEITVYSGHARYGSGPDFDAKDVSVENFRIGVDEALRAAGRRTSVEEARSHGVAVDEENDLREMVRSGDFDREQYRVLFFSACTSLAYLDEVRQEVGGPGTTDVVATRRPSMFTLRESAARLGKVERFLEGILAAESIQEITAGLDEVERGLRSGTRHRMPREGVYESSGFGDNPAVP